MRNDATDTNTATHRTGGDVEIAADDVQSLLYTGFGKLKEACVLMLEVVDSAPACASLHALATDGLAYGAFRRDATEAVQCALSAEGLRRLGVKGAAVDAFALPFVEGIDTPFRRRALGDLLDNAPERWQWSDCSAHAVLLCYATDATGLQALIARMLDTLRGWRECHRLPTQTLHGHREHFGFRDGLAQPWIDGMHAPKHADDRVAPGEFLLGHRDNHGERSSAARSGALEFGFNSSYLVLRQLDQDVAVFWRDLIDRAGGDPALAVRYAAKLMGRWPDGALLKADDAPTHAAAGALDQRSPTFADDKDGLACPLGAHIRRANPRDGLLADPARSIEAVRSHRILRRGRSYGRPFAADWLPAAVTVSADCGPGLESEPRGLLFACLCARPSGQFELVQQTWLNNPKHDGLRDEVDPIAAGRDLLADARRFSIPAQPFRERMHARPNPVRVVGGGYFLLPGRSALLRLLNATSE